MNADSDLRTGIRSSSGQKKRKKFVPAIRAIWRKQVKLSSRFGQDGSLSSARHWHSTTLSPNTLARAVNASLFVLLVA